MPTRRGRQFPIRCSTAAAAIILAAGAATIAQPQASPVILQWFETPWSVIEYRMPDFFIAGYNMTWLPPPSKASDNSVGYDPFDRFDLGRPGTGNGTLYGTEQSFREMIGAFHRANGQAIIDSIMNHNGARTSNGQFIADGGWPGFYCPSPPSNWGDFHDGSTQSQNPISRAAARVAAERACPTTSRARPPALIAWPMEDAISPSPISATRS